MSRSVGEFTLVGHLGEGSFATVFLARHRDSGRDFAMKAISRSRIQGKLQENLESEISILKSFRHVNIVDLHDIKKTERHIYLVLEYCRGGDLRTLIRRHGRLAEPTVRHFMRHLGAGLHFLWSKSLVHRDLKPQNLLLSSPGLDAILKIADFGFARHLARASMAETICGSPLYMAPEILQGQKYGAKADLWSVGAILYEMLAGKPPFGGGNQIQLLANIRRGPTPPPREGFYPFPEDVPPPGRACSELLFRLLVPDPEHRASFREFFQSDVLARSAPADALDSTSAALVPRSAAAGDTRGDLVNRSRVDGGDPRASGRDASNVGVEYSGHGKQQEQKQRVSVSQPRGMDVQRSQAVQEKGKPQGQGRGGGGWWPLAGWRWGGGGGDGQHDVPDSRGRGGRDDPRYGRLTRTFSDPPVGGAHHQQSRSQTPRGVRGGRGGGGDVFIHQQGSVARLSRGQLVTAQQQTGPSRSPVTPPSPTHGPSVSRRYNLGAAVPIPIRKQQDTGLRGGDGGGESRGYRDRDTRMQEVGSPSRGNTGRSDYPSSPYWPRSAEESPRDHRRERRDGEMATPVQSRESTRLRSHGPNSAPEISYMGHAASRARERAAAAAAAAAAGLRGVAFSLTASPASSPKVVPPKIAQPSTPRQGGRKNASISGGEMSSGNRHSRPPSLDLGARAPSDITVHASAGRQLTVTPSPSSTAGNVHAAGLTSMDRYPLLQVAAMVSAQRQRLWVDAGSFVPGTVSSAMVIGSGAAEVEAGDGVGVERIRRRLEHEISMQQQQGAAGGTRPSESGDGSGESDDFVIVDGALSDQAESPGGGSKRGGGGRGGEIGDAHRAYRIGGTAAGGGDSDARPHGSRPVPAEGRLVSRGGTGQVGKGLQQGEEGASRAAGEDQGGGERRGAGVPPLSLEGVMQCLQIVELFGRRAVLLAQLGDSRLAPAVQRRQRESLELQMGATTVGDGWGVRDIGRVAAVGLVDQDTTGNASAFARDVPLKPPLFAAEDDSWLLSPSSARAPVSNPVFGTTVSCRGGGIHPGVDNTNLSGTDDGATNSIHCEPRLSCESDRLFGEALVLYLKSLSMAKEAIVWGNQALESLPAVAAAATGAGANSARAGTAGSVPSTRHPHVYQQPSPVSSPGRRMPPPGSPHTRSTHKVGVTRSGGGGMTREEASRTPLHQPTGAAADVRTPSQRSRIAGSSRVGYDSTSPSSGSAGAGGLGTGVSTASVLSKTQVAARGASLLGWLKGQFSTVLKRAEKCRVELRGSMSASPNTPKGSGIGRKYVPPSPPETTKATMVGSPGLQSAGARAEGMPPQLSRRHAPPSSPSARGSSPGGDCQGRWNEHGSIMPASPEAIAVSARDIVVRAALAQAQDSAASEVLGMWETARKGYEKAAFLLETLLLDALIARPETGAGLARTSGGALGRSETLSPIRSPVIASPGGSTVLSGGGGLLSEADQRILQKYMTRFARRSSEVAGIEKEEARAAASAVSAEALVREGEGEGRQKSIPVLRPFGDDGGERGVVGGQDTHTPMRGSDGSI